MPLTDEERAIYREALLTIVRKPNGRRPWLETLHAARDVAREALIQTRRRGRSYPCAGECGFRVPSEGLLCGECACEDDCAP